MARPGSVLVDGLVKDAAAEEYQWSFAGKRRLTGIAEEVALFRAREAAAPGERDEDEP